MYVNQVNGAQGSAIGAGRPVEQSPISQLQGELSLTVAELTENMKRLVGQIKPVLATSGLEQAANGAAGPTSRPIPPSAMEDWLESKIQELRTLSSNVSEICSVVRL